MKKKSTKEERKARRTAAAKKFGEEVRNGWSEAFRARHGIFSWVAVYAMLALTSLFFTDWTANSGEYPASILNWCTRALSLFLLTGFGLPTAHRKTIFAAGATVWSVWMILLSDVPSALAALVFVVGVVLTVAFRRQDKKALPVSTPLLPLGETLLRYFYGMTALTFVLELIHSLNLNESNFNVTAPFRLILTNPDRFMLNVSVVFFFGSFILVAKRRNFSFLLYSVIWLVLDVISMVKINNLHDPIMVSDIFAVVDMWAVIFNFFHWYYLLLALLAVAAVIFFLVWLARREKRSESDGMQVTASGVIALGLLASFLCSCTLSYARFSEQIPLRDFYRQGFASSFVRYTARAIPPIQNENANLQVAEIRRTVEELSAPEKTVSVQNIVVIQLESFWDPADVTELRPEIQLERDPLPFLHFLQKNYSSGTVGVPVYGGQTVKSEFEFLCGLDLSLLPAGLNPYVTTVNSQPTDSAVRYLKDKGFAASAVHDYQGEFFSRNEVYRNLGFDRFVPVECMPDVERKDGAVWANDSVLADEIAKALDSNRNGKNFVFAVTVQSHGSYNPIEESEYPMTITGLENDKTMEGKFQYYVSQLIEVDRAMQEIVEMLDAREEPTVVFFYGDHLPKFAGDLCDITDRQYFTTDYYSWNNLGLEKKDANMELSRLFSRIMEDLELEGNFIHRFRRIYGQKLEAGEITEEELRQAEELVSNNLVYEPETFPANETYRIGYPGLLIADVSQAEEGREVSANVYRLVGSGLTNDTVITVNGKMYNILRENENSAVFETGLVGLKEGDVLTLRIVGERMGAVFCESEEYIFREKD